MGDWVITKGAPAPAPAASDWVITKPDVQGDAAPKSAPKVHGGGLHFIPEEEVRGPGVMRPERGSRPGPDFFSPEGGGTFGERLGQAAGAVNSGLDSVSFGNYGVLNRAVGDPLKISKGIDEYRGTHPTLRHWTDAAMAAPAALEGAAGEAAGPVAEAFRSPLRKAGQIAGDIVDRVLPQAATRAGKFAKTVFQGAGTGAIAGATTASTSGASLPEIGNAAVEGGEWGGLSAGALGAGATATGSLGDAVVNSRGGKARQFIEKHGGEVSMASPGKKGPYDSMDVSGTTDADIGAQAATSAEKGLGMLNQEKKGVLGVLGRRMGALDESPAGKATRDVSDLIPQIQDALGEIDIASATEQQLATALGKITTKQGPGFNPDTDPYVLSEADLNKTRRRLDRAAGTGQSNDAKLGPLKQAAHEARTMVDEGPYADVNARYSKESKNYQASRRLLGINERPRTPEEKKTAVDKVTNLITRRGQNTVTAGKQEGDLSAFEEKHPQIGEEFAKPAMLRNKADISFHLLPQKHGGLIDRTGSAIGSGALLEGIASLLGHGHMSPGKIGAAVAGGLTLQNAPAIQARMLYPGALEAKLAEPNMLKLLPLLQAARAAQGDE